MSKVQRLFENRPPRINPSKMIAYAQMLFGFAILFAFLWVIIFFMTWDPIAATVFVVVTAFVVASLMTGLILVAAGFLNLATK